MDNPQKKFQPGQRVRVKSFEGTADICWSDLMVTVVSDKGVNQIVHQDHLEKVLPYELDKKYMSAVGYLYTFKGDHWLTASGGRRPLTGPVRPLSPVGEPIKE